MKEEILKKTWHRKGIDHPGKKIHMHHNHAPKVLKKQRDYAEAKAALKERNIRFQTPFPAKLWVHYKEGTVIYNSAEAATADMAERGIPVMVVKNPSLYFGPDKPSDLVNQRKARTPGKYKHQAGRHQRDFKDSAARTIDK